MSTEETPAVPSAGAPDEALRRERDDLYDRLLRVTAEFDNYRRRTERERREWSEATTADVLREVLPTLDDLERALAASSEAAADSPSVQRLRDGVEIIRKQMTDALKRRGVEPIDVVGADFDPEWHEAVAHEPAGGDRRDGEVTAEIRRGYRIGQKLLRPAMVKVAKA
ncbi:MAG TPA: nucleotide exchange factor GrpE [Vicinamibacterales bacterium]|jgi:molecular chaperone GrpE|nr:nucleotide exchange factor GrpE [Vicinamibacterales bacterium]